MYEADHAKETWRSTIATVHAHVGYAPAMAMLSAYGFYDGQMRDDPGGRPAALTGIKYVCCLHEWSCPCGHCQS